MNDSNNQPIALNDILLRKSTHDDKGKCVDKRTVKVIATYKNAITVRPVTATNGAKVYGGRVFRISDPTKQGWIVHNEPLKFPHRPKKSPEHGLVGYRQGCRCDICRETQNAYLREYRRNNPKLKKKHREQQRRYDAKKRGRNAS